MFKVAGVWDPPTASNEFVKLLCLGGADVDEGNVYTSFVRFLTTIEKINFLVKRTSVQHSIVHY